jgi:hypothetical protein
MGFFTAQRETPLFFLRWARRVVAERAGLLESLG